MKKKQSINKITNGFNNLIKHPAAWNKLYKIDLFRNNNIQYPVGKWYEDLGTFPKLLMLSSKVSIVEKSLYNYIQNSSSIMHTYDDRIYQIYDVITDVTEFAKKKKIFKKYKDNLEFINIYHILVGTIYRASFRDDFKKQTIVDIVDFVERKYPNWSKNEGIKGLSFAFRVYLGLIKRRRYNLLVFMLKRFNRKVDL